MNWARLFWVTKHGIRMTGMPAWGLSHGDGEIWDMVAFIKRLPTLSAREYQDITGADDRPKNAHSH